MRTSFLLLVLAFYLFTVTGCGPKGPEAVAEKYLNGFMHMDFEAAKSVSTKETRETIEMMEELSKKMVSDSVRAYRKKIKVKILKTEEYDSKATVTFTTSESSAEQKLYLVKEDDKWLVSTTKLQQYEDTGMSPPAPVQHGDPSRPDPSLADTVREPVLRRP